MTDDYRAEEMRWYQGRVYRTLHRVAARDSAITLGVHDDGRLEAFEHGTRVGCGWK
jgi:hypothetical protein